MKKIISILLCAVMLSVYFTVFSVPTFASYNASDDINGNISDAKPGDTINLFSEGGSKKVLIPMGSCVEINKSCTINFKSYIFCRSVSYTGPIFRITADNVTLNFENCQIQTGKSNEEGSVFYIEKSNCTINGQGSTKIVDCCTNGEDGGAIYVNDNGNGCKILNLEFNQCSGDDGGTIYIDGDSCKIQKCSFGNSKSKADGGAVYLNGKGCTVEESFFANCSSGADGGAICVNKDNCHIENCHFNNCKADDDGGAIYVCYNTDGARIYDCTFEDCSCKDDGQYVYGDGDDPDDEDDTWVARCGGHSGEKEYYYDCACDFTGSGFTLSGGNTWIIAVGAVVIICGLVAIMVANKKKKLADANVETAAETTEKAEE